NLATSCALIGSRVETQPCPQGIDSPQLGSLTWSLPDRLSPCDWPDHLALPRHPEAWGRWHGRGLPGRRPATQPESGHQVPTRGSRQGGGGPKASAEEGPNDGP